jgi:Kef-type K+ transport system membrane component KefB
MTLVKIDLLFIDRPRPCFFAMSDPNFLRELIVVLTATIAIVFVFQKLRLPTIVGFLLTGVIIGPHGFQLVQSVGQWNWPKSGWLLLTIGRIPWRRFWVQRRVVWAGLLQVVLTTLVVLVVLSTRSVGEVGLSTDFWLEQHGHRPQNLP